MMLFKTEVLSKMTGGLRKGMFSERVKYDFVLRATNTLSKPDIVHVPRVLYHRDVASKPELAEWHHQKISDCVQEHIKRSKINASAEPFSSTIDMGVLANKVLYNIEGAAPVVSVIIPTKNRAELLKPCLDSIFEHVHHYPGNVEVIVINHDSDEPETLSYFKQISGKAKVLEFSGTFNWSALNNFAVQHAAGDVFVFLNNDTVVISPDWLNHLVATLQVPDVGVVGAKLLYEDGTIQHAGVVAGTQQGNLFLIHEAVGETTQSGGYLFRTMFPHACSSVTGACLATSRKVFKELGGFEEVDFTVAFNDIDYCFKAREAGYWVVYQPACTLYHLESKSRGGEDTAEKQARSADEIRSFRERWVSGGQLVDPFYNPHFEYGPFMHRKLVPPPSLETGFKF